MSQNRDACPRSLGSGEPDGSVFVLLDECYSPTVGVAAVIVESSDATQLNDAISTMYDTSQSRHYLAGLKSFDEFRRTGFHASSDPMEVRIAFVEFLAGALDFKSMIVYANPSQLDGLTEKQALIVITDRLARDVIETYRGRAKLTFICESAQAMDLYVDRTIRRAVKKVRKPVPELEIYFGNKRQPDLLALPDYVLHIFNQWLQTDSGKGGRINPDDHQSRSMKAVLGSISSARTIDGTKVIRRSTP